MVRDESGMAARVTQELLSGIGERRFRTWFDTRVAFQLDQSHVLQVTVGSPLERDCLQRQFLGDLQTACLRAGAGERRVVFRVEERTAPTPRRPQAPDKPHSTQIPPAGKNPQPPQSALVDTTGARQTQAAFAEFVAGDGNAAALELAHHVAAGGRVASPLLIWGPTGVGKTHLLRAIRQQLRKFRPRARAIYLTAEQFTTAFVEAVHGRGLPSFRNKHRGVDLFLLDDLQFLIGKPKTLEELHHTLDTLSTAGSQVVCASDCSPSRLRSLGGDLASRLGAGVSVEIATPDLATRRRLLAHLAKQNELEIDAGVADTIARGVRGGARELMGVLNRLRVANQLVGEAITPDLARRVIEETNLVTTPRVRFDDIQSAVCKVFGVERGDLKSDKRTKAVTQPRMLAMWLARKYTRAPWSEIGAQFGRRSHSTVISACRRIDSVVNRDATAGASAGDRDLQEALRQVEAELRTG